MTASTDYSRLFPKMVTTPGARVPRVAITGGMGAARITVDEGKQIFELFTTQTKIPDPLLSNTPKLIDYCNRISSSDTLEEDKKAQIRNLVLDKLPAILNGKPVSFSLSTLIADKDSLQRVLSPELDRLLKLEDDADEAHLIKIGIEKVRLAARFGIKGQACGGANGARIHSSLENRKIAVFKRPVHLSMFQVGEQAKTVVGQARLLSDNPRNRVYAEVIAADLDRRLGFNVVPAATMCEIEEVEGAFIQFLHGYQPLNEIEQALRIRRSFLEAELTHFQRAVLLDFLTGNLDCHSENLFISLSGAGEIKSVKVIDFGNAFIQANPGPLGPKGNQYAWGTLPLAEQRFTEESLEFIRRLPKEAFEDFIRETSDDFMSDAMANLLRDRFHVLIEYITTGKIRTPKDLSKLHTDGDFQKLRD